MVARQLVMRIVVAACVVVGWAHNASAQPIGTYRFQLQPFCNVVTLSIIQVGTIFTLDGFDDLCGAATRASASGTAFPNPDGTIGFGLTLVFAPHAVPIHIDATISLATITGSWHDSVGHTGTLVVNPSVAAGVPRPPPLEGAVVPASKFEFQRSGGFFALGNTGVGTLGVNGAGTRMMWYPGKAAFRAGEVDATHWDEANVGIWSVAFGANTIASGGGSVAMGTNTRATGSTSLAIGDNARAGGSHSTAIGYHVTATGDISVVLGFHAATSSHGGAFVFGDGSTSNDVVPSASNQFVVRSAGGAKFFSNSAMNMGVKLDAGAGAWTQISDAARKRDFRDLDGEAVLLKLRVMPIREWSYLSQDPLIRHVGPTAQDFRAAFGLGEDPLGITTIDAEGIALRAIQALEVRTATLREENLHLAAENASLRRALDDIRQELASLRPRERR